MRLDTIFDRIESDARERKIPIILDDSRRELLRVVKEFQPKRILEIGTAVGYSGGLMLSVCQGRLDSIDIDYDRQIEANNNLQLMEFLDRVTLYCGDASDILARLSGNRYDFIFIDGPKSKYLEHYNIVIDSLNSGGIIFVDNIHFRGMVNSKEYPPHRYRTIVFRLREFIEFINNDDRVSVKIMECGDGIAIIKKL